jgi:hypothetical protein
MVVPVVVVALWQWLQVVPRERWTGWEFGEVLSGEPALLLRPWQPLQPRFAEPVQVLLPVMLMNIPLPLLWQ